jgi:hypothetical protein
MKASRETFGPLLRLERERRGIALSDVADATKIKESLFADLERGDLSKWPQGIFRRAHLCAYVSAIGLPSQPVLDEFLRLFPPADLDLDCEKLVDGTSTAGPSAPNPTARTAGAAGAPHVTDRVWILSFDLAAMCVLATMVAALIGAGLWSVVACVAIGYSTAGIVCVGQSFGAYVQRRIQCRTHKPVAPEQAVLLRPDVRLIVSRVERPVPSGRLMNEDRDIEKRRASA